MIGMTQTAFHLKQKCLDAIRQLAILERITVSEWIRRAIVERICEQEQANHEALLAKAGKARAMNANS